MKNKHTKNIKVNMYNVDKDGNKTRTSTTLNYGICNYYFSEVLYREKALKLLSDKRFKDSRDNHRAWLEEIVQGWALTQTIANSDYLESLLLQDIFNKGYQLGLEKNKENLGLDL